MMTAFFETASNRASAWLISELGPRDRGTLLAGTFGVSGMVLGRVTASGKYTPLKPAATDGSQIAAAILHTSANSIKGDRPVLVTSPTSWTEVAASELTWPPGISAPAKSAAVAALKAKGIIVR